LLVGLPRIWMVILQFLIVENQQNYKVINRERIEMAFRDWYEKNKEHLNRRRRQRYHKDPNYREKAITRSREDYAAKTINQEKVDRRVFSVDAVKLISIGKLADAIGRKVLTVRRYHMMGVIPQPSHLDSRGWRLYTVDQLRLIVATFDCFDRGIIPSLEGVGRELKKKWPK
jgi:hypothetical protein